MSYRLGTRGETRRAAAEAEAALVGRVRRWRRIVQPVALAPHVQIEQWVRGERVESPKIRPVFAPLPEKMKKKVTTEEKQVTNDDVTKEEQGVVARNSDIAAPGELRDDAMEIKPKTQPTENEEKDTRVAGDKVLEGLNENEGQNVVTPANPETAKVGDSNISPKINDSNDLGIGKADLNAKEGEEREYGNATKLPLVADETSTARPMEIEEQRPAKPEEKNNVEHKILPEQKDESNAEEQKHMQGEISDPGLTRKPELSKPPEDPATRTASETKERYIREGLTDVLSSQQEEKKPVENASVPVPQSEKPNAMESGENPVESKEERKDEQGKRSCEEMKSLSDAPPAKRLKEAHDSGNATVTEDADVLKKAMATSEASPANEKGDEMHMALETAPSNAIKETGVENKGSLPDDAAALQGEQIVTKSNADSAIQVNADSASQPKETKETKETKPVMELPASIEGKTTQAGDVIHASEVVDDGRINSDAAAIIDGDKAGSGPGDQSTDVNPATVAIPSESEPGKPVGQESDQAAPRRKEALDKETVQDMADPQRACQESGEIESKNESIAGDAAGSNPVDLNKEKLESEGVDAIVESQKQDSKDFPK
eukprot:Plantae.Rhodophyta-Hildenbrandia_rubra.ctg13228.p2 GENE.Plantae.Rhodophyta-Hildenbrandia_rubra.ctg13228~~Plantae.Rhodophyta-Hildenbrandia_rubra.ctg13228.p2  ORF type:complete len:605 (+),score=162.05 Plantae.Rhodophyta-Hildenbrandia_rubra.ctg13228:612-2426(+)